MPDTCFPHMMAESLCLYLRGCLSEICSPYKGLNLPSVEKHSRTHSVQCWGQMIDSYSFVFNLSQIQKHKFYQSRQPYSGLKS